MEYLTGLNLSIGDLNIDVKHTSMKLTNVLLYNPQGYSDAIMADIPYIYLDFDLKDYIKGKRHYNYLDIDLRELTIVKISDKEINLHALRTLRRKKDTSAENGQADVKIQLIIDKLRLKVGTVIYKDYSQSATESKIRIFNVNIDKTYHDIKDIRSLVNFIVFTSLAKTTIARLAHFDVTVLTDTASGLFSMIKNAASKTGKAIKKGSSEVTGDATSTIENTRNNTDKNTKY